MARARVDERDRTLRSLPRRGVDELEPGDLQPQQRLGEVRDLEADVVEPLALRFEEAGHARAVVGRFDQLDLRLADGQERDAHAVAGDVHDGLELEVQHVAPQWERRIDRADDQRDVMDLADVADGCREGAGGRSHGVFLHADAP